MQRSGDRDKQLREAIISAYPRQADLRIVIHEGLSENLEAIAGGKDYTEVVFNLIQWAQAQGQFKELVEVLCEDNPENEELKEFCQRFERQKTSKIVPPPNLTIILWSSLIVTCFVIGIRFLGMIELLELSLFDWFLTSRPSEFSYEKHITIVEVSEEDIQIQHKRNEKGLGSVSDMALTELLTILEKYKPAAIGFDLYRDFSEDPLAPKFQALQNQLIAICELPNRDNELGISPPPPPAISPQNVGFSNFILDRDDVLRRAILAIPSDSGHLCQSSRAFGLLVAMRYLQSRGVQFNPDKLTIDHEIWEIGINRLHRIDSYQYGGYQNVEAFGFQLLLNYRQPRNNLRDIAPHYNIEDIREGNVDGNAFEGKIVLIGVTAPSEATDWFRTPYDNKVSGMTIHAHIIAQIVSTALEGRSSIWVWPEWLEIAWLGIWSIAGGLLMQGVLMRPQYWLTFLSMGILFFILLLNVIGWIIMVTISGWIPVIPPILSLILGVILSEFFSFLRRPNRINR